MVESLPGVTIKSTSVPSVVAETVARDPLVPTIAYSVIAILSLVSNVTRTSDTSVCDPEEIFTKNFADLYSLLENE
jgi:hypothetical protein